MPTVPQYNRSVSPQVIPNEYLKPQTNMDMFGGNISEAQANLGNAMNNFSIAMNNLKEHYDTAKRYEFANKMQDYEQEYIRGKENGYLYKTGKDAMGQSQIVMQNYDKYAADLLSQYKFSPENSRAVKNYLAARRMNVANYVEKHDFDESNRWNNTVFDDGYSNIYRDAAFYRNDADSLKVQLGNLHSLMTNDIRYQQLDPETREIYKNELTGKFHESVLSALIADNSLRAKQYYDENKQYLSQEKQASYLSSIKNLDDKYTSRRMADDIVATSKSEEEALGRAEKIEDIDLSDSVQQRIRQKYSQDRRLEEQRQSDLMDAFLNNSVNKFKNGEQITEDDIPKGLDGKHYLQAKSNLESLNRAGDVQTDADTETYLWYTASNDADRFKTMNLDIYKMSLSAQDFSALKKRQQDIQKGDYFTIIGDTKATKNYIHSVTGINNKDEVLYNEYQGMVRALEQKYGRSATDVEKEKILKYLGTNKDAYKLLERGVREQVGFYKNIANKISYYSSRHNGDMPSENEVYQWLKEDTLKYYNKKYSDAQKTISNVAPKAGETKTLTYLADIETPQYAKDLGLAINVTSRYRENNGKYKSHHTDGTGMDVSMSEHNSSDKRRIIEKYLNNPRVKAIGTSDPELIRLYKNKKYNGINKIVDERNFDAQYGTNHVNHIHITTINDGTQNKQNDIITMKNTLKRYGYSDAQIAAYFQQRGLR